MSHAEWMKSLVLLLAGNKDVSQSRRELLRNGCAFFGTEMGMILRAEPGGGMRIEMAQPTPAQTLEGKDFPFDEIEHAIAQPVFFLPAMAASWEDGWAIGSCVGLPIYRDGLLEACVCWISPHQKPEGFPTVDEAVYASLAAWYQRESFADRGTLQSSESGRDLSHLPLGERNQHVAAILQGSQHFLLLTDPKGRILEASRLAEKGTGLSQEEIRTIHVWELPTLSDSEPAVMRAREAIERAERGETVRFQEELESLKGHLLKIDASYTPIYNDQGSVCFLLVEGRDITKRIEVERSFQESQKLESLGVLAGGIAHDFNNLLTGILGNANLCNMELPPDSPYRPYLDSIETAAIKSAELCHQMLAYSGRGHFIIGPHNLSELVGELGDLLSPSLKRRGELTFELAEDLPNVQIDRTQIQQIIMNLVINASEAITPSAGIVTVRTSQEKIGPDEIETLTFDGGIRVGPHVVLTVDDNGCGIEPEVLRRIFEPFYSTKFTGRGLGLAAVSGIVRGHRGGIHVTSKPGKGTSFRLFLPVASPAKKAPPPKPPEAMKEGIFHGTVLVVDDDPIVRTVTTKMLARLGFKTLQAENGKQGVQTLQAHRPVICLVLLDLTMPVMDGEEAFRAISALGEPPPVVLMSGFSEQDTVERFTEEDLSGFLAKPIRYKNLVAVVSKVLSL